MTRTTIGRLAALTLSLAFAAACGSSSKPSATTSTSSTTSGASISPTSSSTPGTSSPAGVVQAGSSYRPAIDPAKFRAVVDNAWFPLKPGSVYTYKGVKDGEPSQDVYTVSHATKTIDGVPCAVISDQLSLSGKLFERTTDYYTQDLQGNVWYFGETTAELDKHGKVTSTEGTWLAGRNGAQPGIFMEANPVVGHAYRQEYYAGHAEDQFKVVNLASPVKVPYGSFSNALLTQEQTAVEPGVLDHKYYVKGVGEVAEISIKGPVERALLVSYKAGQ
jgi:hypothetical protein